MHNSALTEIVKQLHTKLAAAQCRARHVGVGKIFVAILAVMNIVLVNMQQKHTKSDFLVVQLEVQALERVMW